MVLSPYLVGLRPRSTILMSSLSELFELNPYPTREQKDATLAKIRSLPGCGHYTYVNLNQRLASHRSKRHSAGDSGANKNTYTREDVTTSAQICTLCHAYS